MTHTVVQIYRLLPVFESKLKYVLNSQNTGVVRRISKCSYPIKETEDTDVCPNKAPCKPPKKKKKSFFKKIFGDKVVKKPPPPIESCRLKNQEYHPDPDLTAFGGKAFKTCGSAYIIQKDMLPSEPCEITSEEKAIKIIEANCGVKDCVIDPMPPFTTVEQRMMDLDQRRLHPLYRVYQNIPKKKKLDFSAQNAYKTRSGPINANEIPMQFKFNSKILRKKNMFSDYKRVEPPRQLVAKIAEIQKNEKPTIKKRMPVVPSDEQGSVGRKNVFDTLYQQETKF